MATSRKRSRAAAGDRGECRGRQIVFGVTGSIAAYKGPEVLRGLQEHGADVRVIMTASACQLVSPWTFQSLSGHGVMTRLFAEADERVPHIHLAEWADLLVVAPATANIIGKAACGIADDALSTVLLSTQAPVFFAPAMNANMLDHPAVCDNMRKLRERGCRFIEPGTGWLACGTEGRGRMAEPEHIVEAIREYFRQAGTMAGKRVLVTAGRTEEPLDPVRMLTNRSTGKMGYALAEAARRRGAEVVLISGPSDLSPPEGVQRVPVQTAEEMAKAVFERVVTCDVVLMAAAVSDFRPAVCSPDKIKKTDMGRTIELEATTDILRRIGRRKGRRIVVGFALETGQGVVRARQKLEEKKLDLIVLNNPLEAGCGFAADTNAVTLISSSGEVEKWPLLSKREVAERILARVSEQLAVWSRPSRARV